MIQEDERRPARNAAATTYSPDGSSVNGRKPTAAQLLETPGALLTRGHLRELGLERRAIDSVFRELDVVVLPGYARPMIRASDYLALIETCTYRGDRVRP